MKQKPKICKSVNPKTKGLGCGELSSYRRFGLCPSCYVDWLLNTKEGQKHLDKSRIKGKKKVQEKQKAADKKLKEETIDYTPKIQQKINEIARLIDVGLPCLATQKHARQIHGGHVLSRGSQPSIKYNLHNIHRQSAQSNHWQADDIKMREGLEREYGKEYLDFVLSLKQTRALKFTKPQYLAFYRIACDIVNDLRKQGKTFNTKERIEMRNKLNIKLGIYHLRHSRYDQDKRRNEKSDS